MKIGEQDQTGTEMRVFGRLRFLDLDDQFGLIPNVAGSRQDFGARVEVFAIGDGASGAGLRFDQHAMPGFAQRGYAARNQSDARFVIFDFLGDADDHWGLVGGEGQGTGTALHPIWRSGVWDRGPRR